MGGQGGRIYRALCIRLTVGEGGGINRRSASCVRLENIAIHQDGLFRGLQRRGEGEDGGGLIRIYSAYYARRESDRVSNVQTVRARRHRFTRVLNFRKRRERSRDIENARNLLIVREAPFLFSDSIFIEKKIF